MMKWLTLFLVSLGAPFSLAKVDHGKAQIKWLRKKGGYVNPKVSIKRFYSEDSSPMGWFTSKDIPRGETLMIIPKKCLLTSTEGTACATTRNLIKEYHLGKKSEFAPYVQYLFSLPTRQLPSAWSEAGKDLLEIVCGDLLPDDIFDISFQHDCGGTGDALEEAAYAYLVSRSWDETLVPVYDTMNHRNGYWTNVDSNSIHSGNDVIVFASRDIRAGEQLHLSYNQCTDCGEFAKTYFTPNFLTHFAFVEQYPQRWNFQDAKIRFEVDVKELDPSNAPFQVDKKDLKITWLTGKPTKKRQLKYLEGNLERLRNLTVSEETKQLEAPHERDVTTDFYNAFVIALELALEAATSDESLEETPVEEVAPKVQKAHSLASNDDPVTAQIEWLRSKGGFFSSKLFVRPLDSTSQVGVFASKDIPKGETLLIIPKSCLITSAEANVCNVTRTLMREIQLQDESEFAPYVSYLSSLPRGQIPLTWSEEGQELLQTVLGEEPIEGISFERECKGSGDFLEEDTHMLVKSHGGSVVMIPIYDMIRHGNGHWTNVDTNSVHMGREFFVVATRDIAAGEQLYRSYNQCTDCEEDEYVMPDMLMDFGFVERYPQWWRFDGVTFRLDSNETGDAQELQLTWSYDGEPKSRQIDFFRSELKRLQELSDTVTKQAAQLASSHERNVTMEYYQAMTIALEYAIGVAETGEGLDQDEL